MGKNEILQKEILIWLFLVHKLLDFWVPGLPPPLKENSAHGVGLSWQFESQRAEMGCTLKADWVKPPGALPHIFFGGEVSGAVSIV